MSAKKAQRGVIRFLLENSAFLIGGAIAALVWANFSPGEHGSYRHFAHATILDVQISPQDHGLTLHFLVNDILMAIFFAIAAKEVWEALLPGGSLSNLRTAATPLLATLGGMAGPAVLYLLGVSIFGPKELEPGWAIPMATDIAFSYMVARFIFGPGHPAIPFLLLLAIADDAGGLLVLAVFYPTETPEPAWLLLSVGAVLLGFAFRKLRLHSFWWYILIPGVLSWISFQEAHLHPALGLVPIIPTMPHEHSDLGVYARQERGRHDTLNEFATWWKNPVQLILGLFGLVNAGVELTSFGNGTFIVLVGLLIGKPLGITAFTWFGLRFFGLQVPAGMSMRHVVVLGAVAGFGFTVALFVSDVAFRGPENAVNLDAAKLGALGSVLSFFVATIAAKVLGVKRLGAERGESADSGQGTESKPALVRESN
jgi:NhaA family Na+:H+ antiporter